MDNYEELVSYIKDFKQHLEEKINKANTMHYPGYHDTIKCCRYQLGVLNDLLRKAKEFDENEERSN